MQTEELRSYKQTLLAMRERLTGEANYVTESIQEDGKSSNSNSPTHFADRASETVDGDIAVLESEHGILNDIQSALASIRNGSYGKCEHCGSPIARQRLEAIPYSVLCIQCAAVDGR